ncbi:MAG: hypothetical protein H6834_16600 [Planctomycetes bacterium]|nr:hypothetical protein [Planctomycetota bacterium]
MSHPNPSLGERGFSIVEAIFGLFLATVVVGGLAKFIELGLGTSRATLAQTSLDSKAVRALASIVRELRVAQFESLAPRDVAPLSSSSIDFRSAVGHGGGQVLWGPPTRISLRPCPEDAADGTDNDGDGLIDEQEIVWTEHVGETGESSRVLVRNVARLLEGESGNSLDDNDNELIDEPGLCFVFEDDAIRIQLTVQASLGNSVLSHTVETTIRPRN